MSRFFSSVSKKAGKKPGSLIHIGKKKTENVRITLIDYDENNYMQKEVKKIEECFPFRDKKTVTWINIDGVHDTSIIEKIGSHFGIHSLVLEDILNTSQRPKMEVFDDYIFIVLRMLSLDEKKGETISEQVSIIMGRNFVISFQETVGDIFDPIRKRLGEGKGKMRKTGPDYLSYSLIDAVVDNYFYILEKFGERVESIEDGLIDNPKPETLQKIHSLKREMIFLRKSVWPLREAVSSLERSESPLIDKRTRMYLRDVYDHTIQVIDTVETFRDMVSGMLDLYLSSISNKMNQVMKVLTIIATIFIPLTFIAGIYGMNFDVMPELKWPFGYFMVWGVMIIIALVMLLYFKRKEWL
ncbi:MAG: magnesium/cobalt transporter CorA [Candidatus Aenigmarchaeota archaeon]|nr:magnesium/cobalt transporter CorA [Candidatus Aenigmarchaeota archaeon]